MRQLNMDIIILIHVVLLRRKISILKKVIIAQTYTNTIEKILGGKLNMETLEIEKTQHEFTIKGIKIMAASKKDAIKKFNHRKK